MLRVIREAVERLAVRQDSVAHGKSTVYQSQREIIINNFDSEGTKSEFCFESSIMVASMFLEDVIILGSRAELVYCNRCQDSTGEKCDLGHMFVQWLEDYTACPFTGMSLVVRKIKESYLLGSGGEVAVRNMQTGETGVVRVSPLKSKSAVVGCIVVIHNDTMEESWQSTWSLYERRKQGRKSGA